MKDTWEGGHLLEQPGQRCKRRRQLIRRIPWAWHVGANLSNEKYELIGGELRSVSSSAYEVLERLAAWQTCLCPGLICYRAKVKRRSGAAAPLG